MFRLNRSRFLGIFCVTIFLYFLLFTDTGSSSSNFRVNTQAGIARKRAREQDLPLRGHLSDEDLTRKTNEQLQGILNSQRKERPGDEAHGNSMGRVYQDPPHDAPARSDLESQGWTREDPAHHDKPADGEKSKMSHSVENVKDDSRIPARPKPKAERPMKEKPITMDNEEDDGSSTEHEIDPVHKKLNEYLKAPVVIFSKSYCPHSKRAKHLLLDIYNIVPRPLVVELDMLGQKVHDPEHDTSSSPDHADHGMITMGKALQNLLAKKTGRATVPNIVVGGEHSIGGNDNIWSLHESGMLVDEIVKFGGRRITKVDLDETEAQNKR